MADSDMKDGILELQRQYKIQQDNNTLAKVAGDKAIADVQARVDAAQAKLDDINNQFKATFAVELKTLTDGQAKLALDQAANDNKIIALKTLEADLNDRMAKAIADNQAILDADTCVLNKNKNVLTGIQDELSNLNDQKDLYAHNIDQLAQDQADCRQKTATAQANLELANSIRNEASQLKADALEAVDKANAILQETQDQRNDITRATSDLDIQQKANAQTLADIKRSQDTLDTQKVNVQNLIDQQSANIAIIQQATEKNRTDLIAITAKQISLNAQQRDIDERMKNLKALEASAPIQP